MSLPSGHFVHIVGNDEHSSQFESHSTQTRSTETMPFGHDVSHLLFSKLYPSPHDVHVDVSFSHLSQLLMHGSQRLLMDVVPLGQFSTHSFTSRL